MAKLKDSLPLVPKKALYADDPKVRPVVVDKLPEKTGEVVVERLNAPEDLELTVTPVKHRVFKDPLMRKVQKFADLLDLGYTPGIAAHKVKSTLKELMGNDKTRELAKELIEDWNLPAEARKQAFRALVNKGMLTSTDHKEKIDYMKLAADDGELGIKTPQNVNVNVGLSPALKGLLDSLTPIAELGPPPEIIEGETEDIESSPDTSNT